MGGRCGLSEGEWVGGIKLNVFLVNLMLLGRNIV